MSQDAANLGVNVSFTPEIKCEIKYLYQIQEPEKDFTNKVSESKSRNKTHFLNTY